MKLQAVGFAQLNRVWSASTIALPQLNHKKKMKGMRTLREMRGMREMSEMRGMRQMRTLREMKDMRDRGE
jgi:hypothetical protein